MSTENISGHHVIVAQFDKNRLIGGVRVDKHPIHPSWKNRLGHYKLMNPPDVEFWELEGMELKIEDGYLVKATTHGGEKNTAILRPVNEKEAIEEGLGRGFGGTVRIIVDNGGHEILTDSGLRFKRIDK